MFSVLLVKKGLKTMCTKSKKHLKGDKVFSKKKKKEKDIQKILVWFIIATVHFRNCLMANVF